MNANKFVVGVDFGTLSGRAVVVRVSDGAELGSAVHEYAHGVIERELPGSGVRLGPDWALQSPQDWIDVLRVAVPGALAAAGVQADDVIGIGTDFTACTVLPATADGTPSASTLPNGRTPGPSCGSTMPPRRTQTGSTSWRPGAGRAGCPGTAARSPPSGSSPRRCRSWRRTRRRTPRPTGGSRPPTGSSGSSPGWRAATSAPPDTRGYFRTTATRPRSSSPS
ncbi:hypothetical protein ACFSTC_12810 [Nonomuraea ferruginea]